MIIDFAGKVALVTGASSGIGAAVARGLGGAGARVAVHYRSGESQARAIVEALSGSGVEAHAFGADLASRSGGDGLVSGVIDHFGAIDILVNNAGSLIRRATTAEMDDDYFDAVIGANLYSTVSCCRAVVPHMVARGSGAIINVSSVAARHGGGAGASLYAAAKAAVATYTRGLAKEVAASGVRVNAIAPGVVDTPFHGRFTSPEAMSAFVATVPIGRAATAEEMVGPVLFLASDSLSAQVVGHILEVNGGMYSP